MLACARHRTWCAALACAFAASVVRFVRVYRHALHREATAGHEARAMG